MHLSCVARYRISLLPDLAAIGEERCTTGLATNKKYIPESTKSWEVLWDPAYRGRVAMLNEPQEALGAALAKLGYSLNSHDPQHLDAPLVRRRS